MMSKFKMSWRTTLFGFATAIIVALGPFASPGAEFNWKNIVLAIVIAGWGSVQKDYNVKYPEDAKV